MATSDASVTSLTRVASCGWVRIATSASAFFVATPTNDDLTFVGVQLPLERAAGLAGRTEATFHEAVAASPAHAGLVATGPRVERFRVARTPDGFFRRSHGPGWALAGDAGHHKDPITAQGMGDAFRDADLLAAAIDHGLDGGPAALDAALAHYEATRDAESAAMFELTTALADVAAPPPPEALELVAALARRPEHIPRYLGVMAGSVPVAEFHDPANIAAICGVPA